MLNLTFYHFAIKIIYGKIKNGDNHKKEISIIIEENIPLFRKNSIIVCCKLLKIKNKF